MNLMNTKGRELQAKKKSAIAKVWGRNFLHSIWEVCLVKEESVRRKVEGDIVQALGLKKVKVK